MTCDVVGDVLASASGLMLVRARADQRDAVERLQHAAYAHNRELLGLEPLPLQADYNTIFRDYEVWVKPRDDGSEVEAALILDVERTDDVLIWSVATAPDTQKCGLGHALLECAERRAAQLGRRRIRLYTGQPLTHLIDWYGRNGYDVERIEPLTDRTIVHTLKTLDQISLA